MRKPSNLFLAMLCTTLLAISFPVSSRAQVQLVPDRQNCEDLAKRAFRACLEDGGDEARCQAILERVLADCRPPRDDDPPEEPPATCAEACERRSSQILDECIRQGIDDEDCAERVRHFQRSCLERCEGDDDPRDPPDGEIDRCRRRCEAHYREVVAACPDDNRLAHMECVEQARKDLSECLHECRPDEPPPPVDPPSCESLCKLQAMAVVRACEAVTGPDSDVDCEARGQAAFDACAERCDGGDDEPNDPPPTCESRCERVAKSYLERCLLVPGADEDACKERSRTMLRRCLQGCEDVPPPSCETTCRLEAQRDYRICVSEIPDDLSDEETEHQIGICREVLGNDIEECREKCDPPPIDPECDEECRRQSREVKQACLDEGIDEDICAARKHSFYRRCVRANCNPHEPPEPPTCEERCEKHVKRLFRHCLNEGGSPEACRERVAPILEECQERCDHEPPPDCKTRCRAGAARVLERCLAAGGDMDRCEALASESFETCATRCERPDPVPCDERCAAVARRLFQRCIDEFGEDAEERCKEHAETMLERCVEGCERPTDPPTCPERCERAGRLVKESCLESGEDEDVCADRRDEFVDRCLENCENPPTCEDRCTRAAQEVQASCLEAGGDEERCAEVARNFKERCDRQCDPEPPTCEEKCDHRVARWFRVCVEQGGDPEECREKAGELRERCHAACETGPAPTCGERCTQIARRHYVACIEEHGEDASEECRERSQELLRTCLHRCNGKPDRCDERCAHRAREVYSRCLEQVEPRVEACIEEGGDPEVCKARAIRHCRQTASGFLSDCIAEHCEPSEPPTCEERCDRAARHIQSQCLEAGGTEDECAEKAGAFREECHERCDHQPPPCEERCDEAVARVAERCAQSDLPAEECEAIVARFRRICEHRLKEICHREDDPDHRAPRRFRRGDVNFDDKFDISDIIGGLRGMFLGEVRMLICEDAVDINDDGQMDIGDAVAGLFNLFRGDFPIAPPHGIEGGHDATFDDLLCLGDGEEP